MSLPIVTITPILPGGTSEAEVAYSPGAAGPILVFTVSRNTVLVFYVVFCLCVIDIQAINIKNYRS